MLAGPFRELAAQLEAQRRDDPGCDRFRWLLEEWRVALFAQELGTAAPVSRKRLAKLWSEVRA